ncbi:hypothetical protein [Longimicrobium sp.]|uniref:hypothetical protein n=1 Tax=Longimicrobium sp. TaxID=2029185 RepID=UPI003B3BD401
MTPDRPNPVHTALAAADRRDRMSRYALYAAALLEMVLLATALLVMDFDDDTHLLILIIGILVYSTLALGLAAIASRAAAADARLLHAIQMLDERRPAA